MKADQGASHPGASLLKRRTAVFIINERTGMSALLPRCLLGSTVTGTPFNGRPHLGRRSHLQGLSRVAPRITLPM